MPLTLQSRLYQVDASTYLYSEFPHYSFKDHNRNEKQAIANVEPYTKKGRGLPDYALNFSSTY